MLDLGGRSGTADIFPSVEFLRKLVVLKREAAAANQPLLTSLVDGAIVETVRLIEHRQRRPSLPRPRR